MTMDNAVVPGTVPPVEAVPPAEVATTTPPPVTLTPEEILNQKIAEAVARAITVETEKAKRELQSTKDKAMAEVSAAQRRAKFAESTLSDTHKRLQTLDPEVANQMELAELRAKEQNRQTMEQEEQATRYQAEVVQRFHENMTQFVTGLGVNPSDPRLDWAGDAPDLLTAQQRILGSVTKIQKENVSALEKSIDTKIKEAEKRIKKELGGEDVNSVSAQMSGGISGDGIPTDRVRLGEFIEKLSTGDYVKLKPKIDEMLAKGLIK